MKLTSKTKSLSVVIPVYNSASSLDELVAQMASVLPDLSREFEVILVNDGSIDQSWGKIVQLGKEYPWIFGINLLRNYGQHNALLCGIRAAHYEVIITMDDDLQHPPDQIHKLLTPLDNGFDVVYGTPLKQSHSMWRNLASYIIRISLQSTMGVNNARKVSSFRAFRTQLRDAFANYRSPFVVLDALLPWGTKQFTAVAVDHHPRHQGASNYSFGNLISLALNMITGFTILPLQLASLMGFSFALFGLLVLFYVVGRYFILGYSIPGFPFLASTIAIFSGVQLFALGIIGEYLARMHFRLMEKPTYVIRDQLTPADTDRKENDK